MNVITIDSPAYDLIMKKLDFLEEEMKKAIRKGDYPLTERWLSNEQVCIIFNCCKRTMQMYRDEYFLPFSQVKSRFYYRAADIEKFLKEYYKNNRFMGRRNRCEK